MIEKSCIFCDRKNFAERLIFEGNDFYIIASIGQITDGGYLLLVPRQHIPCMAMLHIRLQIMAYMLEIFIRNAIKSEYGFPAWPHVPIAFEHGIIGQTISHAHVHFIPAPLNLKPMVKRDFPQSPMEKVISWGDLGRRYAELKQPYLAWTTTDGQRIVCWDPPAPAQYFRKITAQLLNRPERADWREMDKNLDTKLWKNTVRRMKKYF